MDTDKNEKIEDELSGRIIGCAFQVLNTLGPGFLEKVYENALTLELQLAHVKVAQQVPLKVWYRGRVVGDYFADLVVENQIIIELKHAKTIDHAHVAQTLNYLKATGFQRGLILNFGTPRLGIKRLLF